MPKNLFSTILNFILRIFIFIKKLICCAFCKSDEEQNARLVVHARGVKLVKLGDAKKPGCDHDDESLLGPDFSPFIKKRILANSQSYKFSKYKKDDYLNLSQDEDLDRDPG